MIITCQQHSVRSVSCHSPLDVCGFRLRSHRILTSEDTEAGRVWRHCSVSCHGH